jgi:hypothetical protein
MEEPVVIAQWAQPITSGKAGYTAPSYTSRRQFIVFQGVLGENTSPPIEVLAGEGAPTPSGGYAKWAHIPRPQRKALTILEGYEPFVLTVPILFDAVRLVSRREDVETAIQWLEWMGGRGIKFGGMPYHPAEGDSPLVIVYASDGEGNESPLVPKPFQTKDLRWVIDDITWDEHPIRDRAGARIRQAAVVKLLEHVSSAGPSTDSSTTRARLRKGLEGQYTPFKTTSTVNTVRKLLAKHVHPPSRVGEAIGPTLKANKLGSNPEKPLKNGTKVLIPKTFLIP